MSDAEDFIDKLFDKARPVGSIYMSIKDTNPSSLFGGTWSRIYSSFLLAAGDTYSASSTGGEAEHQLTVSELPAHYHGLTHYTWSWGDSSATQSTTASVQSGIYTGNSGTSSADDSVTLYSGGDGSHNNIPPYLAVNVWKRIS